MPKKRKAAKTVAKAKTDDFSKVRAGEPPPLRPKVAPEGKPSSTAGLRPKFKSPQPQTAAVRG